MPIDNREPDRERTEALMQRIGEVVKAHYLSGVGGRQTLVFEVLNALACNTAMILAGVESGGGLGECLQFFSAAMTQQLNNTLESLHAGCKKAGHGHQRGEATHGNNHRPDRRGRARRP